MAAVTVIMENYPEANWLRPVGYSLVALVGAGLVNKGWHWYSDLPLGIAVGYAFGKTVSHPEDETRPVDHNDMKLTFAPMMNQRGNGVLVAMRF